MIRGASLALLGLALLVACDRRFGGDQVNEGDTDNRRPEAVAGPNRSANPGQLLEFDGSDSNDDGEIVEWSWAFGDGTAEETGEIVSHTFGANGVYGVTLTVTDDTGLKGTDTVVVNVDVANPTASFTASAESVLVGEEITFDGSASTAQSPITSHSWSFGDGDAASGATVSHTYEFPGTFRVRLTVTDDQTRSGEADRSIAVAPVPAGVPPTASFTASVTQTQIGVPVHFDATASSGEAPPLEYRWNFGDSTTDTGVVVDHVFDIAGDFRVQLVVEDTRGLTGHADRMVGIDVVTRDPPVAVLIAAPDDGATIGTSVSFDASGSTADGTIVAWRWTFGDSSCSAATCPTTAIVDHAFEFTGTFRVTVEVEDDWGLTDEIDLMYPVIDPASSHLLVTGAFDVIPAQSSHTCPTYSLQLTDTVVTFNTAASGCGGQPMTGFGLNGTSYTGCMNGSDMSLSASQPNRNAGGGCIGTRTTTLSVTFSDLDNFAGREIVFQNGLGCTCSWIVDVTGTRR